MPRIQLMQRWFSLSDPFMEEAQLAVTLCREVAVLDLKSGTVMDATLIAALSSAKNSSGQRAPEIHKTKKGNQWYFGMKANIGTDAESVLVHTVLGTAANIHDVIQVHALVHVQESDVYADSGYQGVNKCPVTRGLQCDWHVATRPGKRPALDKSMPMGAILAELEKTKASIRAIGEHPFRVAKRQFGQVKVRYRGQVKNTAQLHTQFALSNLWTVRRKLLQMKGPCVH